ncbi:MAG: Rap1a/Tai family immunity protein [Micavibrio sp.]|nr:Rap1a/Tai family immunity protein [Micavibrio sp.]
MKNALAAFSLLVCLCALPRPAAAQYMMTKDLARDCLSDKKEKVAACIYYITGVIDYHFLMQSFGTAPTIDFCLPESISKEQAAVLVMAYLRTAPQNDDFIAAATVPLALNKAFPCDAPRAKKKKK